MLARENGHHQTVDDIYTKKMCGHKWIALEKCYSTGAFSDPSRFDLLFFRALVIHHVNHVICLREEQGCCPLTFVVFMMLILLSETLDCTSSTPKRMIM